MFINMGALKD